MNGKLLLRISSVLLLIHLLGHGVGHSTWDKPEDSKMQQVVATMKSYSAEFMGANKSMADYYNGYSLMTFGFFALCIFLLWFCSNIISESREIVKKIIYPIGFILLFFAVVEYIYFFPFAASMSFFAGILAITSILAFRPTPVPTKL